MHKHILAEPPDPKLALQAHQGCVERCQRWLEQARTEQERHEAETQLRAARGEVQRWQARVGR